MLIFCTILLQLGILFKNAKNDEYARKQRETYIATLSHDLKIPTLAQIRALEMLLNEKFGTINDEQKEIVNMTLESCTNMYDMLSAMLAAYRFENNEVVLRYEAINIVQLLEECFNKKYLDLLKQKNIKVKIKANDMKSRVYADKYQIKQALATLIENCISNAIENTVLTCEIKHDKNCKNILLSLVFESPYFSVQKIQNMLKKHITHKEKLDKVGTGIGLYLAKQIIKAHNGNICALSWSFARGGFNIKLPSINNCKLPAFSI